jgi:DNA-binding transcriptional regulator YdaS (Cro superfamily)
MPDNRPPEIVREAAANVGGLSQLAKLMGIRHTTFYRWKEVPAERVLQIEKLTGVSRHDMRPDIYPRGET